MIKPLLLRTALVAALFAGAAAHADTLSVAATPVPHAEILEHIKPALAKQGVELDIKVLLPELTLKCGILRWMMF